MVQKLIIDDIAHSNGLYSTSPKLKVIFSILSLFVVLLFNSPSICILMAISMIFLTIFKAKVPKGIYFKLLSIPVLFGIFSLIFMTLLFGTDVWFNLDVGTISIPLYYDGFSLGYHALFRMFAGVTCTLFLALTTPFTQLLTVLKELKIPESVIEITMLVYRYIFILIDEALLIEHAQKTRFGYSGFKNTYNSLGTLAGVMLVRSLDRGDNLYTTMCSRGYNGNIYHFGEEQPVQKTQIFGIFVFEGIIISLGLLPSLIL
ncbi:cobalt ECF transporter T component CbiQ [Methanococcus voltae]|uniref:Cobalt/nickel transport system permease protein n=1 Tax=Methanococcus voltae PS TaxID=523842 RepID=A0ABT2EX16_METVO|nr:cobalt ECF transporter T component CbiQ [Methanococcus voltae]MBP2172890.1 cobalt/nickel transport system permease protein [Methanococcus voltae]MCS3922488.1 cobalt/nickel transport system permease protein [Methanococcus voltae PS]